jgi:hypothetical protein
MTFRTRAEYFTIPYSALVIVIAFVYTVCTSHKIQQIGTMNKFQDTMYGHCRLSDAAEILSRPTFDKGGPFLISHSVLLEPLTRAMVSE